MKVGTGWIGWTEAQVLDTSMSVIEDAYSAKIDMIYMMMGREAPQAGLPVPHGAKMNSNLFMAMFGGN